MLQFKIIFVILDERQIYRSVKQIILLSIKLSVNVTESNFFFFFFEWLRNI